MTCTGTNGASLAQLQAPRRNRYFYGKLLDVLHLSMEQQYGISASAHLNRLNFGPGVFCGLEVTPIERDGEHGVRVEAGVALDGLGRRIVVPDAVELLPLEITDHCGMPARPQPDALPESLVLSVCYFECEADFAPALVADPVCDGPRRCEAGTWVESYSLVVREGTPAAVSQTCRDEVITHLKAGDVQAALCTLATECPDVPADTCVPLAAIAVAPDGSLTVPDPCAARPLVPTNRALLELIACLAQRIEECCGSNGDHPDPDPTATFRISDLVVGNRAGTVSHKLSGPYPEALVIPWADDLAVVEIWFQDGTLDEASVALGTNVVIADAAGLEPTFDATYPDGGPNDEKIIRLELSAGAFDAETYIVTVSGDEPNPVTSTDGEALNAELTQLPTGNETPGGLFAAKFIVE